MLGVTTAVIQDTRIPRKDGTCAIKLRFTINRKRYYLPLNVHISTEDWLKTQQPNPRGQHKTWKFEFMETQKRAEQIVKNMHIFSLDQVKRELFNYGSQEADVIQLMKGYLQDLKDEGRINTAKTFESSIQSFTDYAINGKRKSIPLEIVTPEWLKKYERWMLGKGKSITTTGIYLRNLRTIFNLAIEKELIPRKAYPFGKRKYQIPAARKTKKALTTEQIKMILDYTPENEGEERARDLWLFSYLCNGINVKDMAYLRVSDICGDRLTFVRAKTQNSTRSDQKTIDVYLTPPAQAAIHRWGTSSTSPNSLVFDFIDPGTDLEKQAARIRQAAKTINKYMKIIGEKLEIPMKITTYTARHSYATVMKRSGASMEFISEALGHKDLKTTENYLDSFESDVKREFQKKLLDFD